MANAAFKAIIRGRVQGVGFRYSAKSEADKYHLTGWVRNLNDGSVEVWAEGLEYPLKRFLEWLNKGPSWAQVDSVESWEQQPSGGYKSFKIVM
ncbi:MAG: acylphosphatase [Spirochaetaceae bacterium]|nr:acylphosphatase [Spirochaetaceae bacterium]